MSVIHQMVLYASLLLLGISLIIPGLAGMIKAQPNKTGFMQETIDGKNQYRALNGMMTGIGLVALWACFDLQNSLILVSLLGYILLLVVIARFYSLIVDGIPGLASWFYLAVELILALIFLEWPPYA